MLESQELEKLKLEIKMAIENAESVDEDDDGDLHPYMNYDEAADNVLEVLKKYKLLIVVLLLVFQSCAASLPKNGCPAWYHSSKIPKFSK